MPRALLGERSVGGSVPDGDGKIQGQAEEENLLLLWPRPCKQQRKTSSLRDFGSTQYFRFHKFAVVLPKKKNLLSKKFSLAS